MQENKTPLSFREQYNDREETKAANENSLFCIVCGTIMFLYGGMGYLCTGSLLSILCAVVAVIGILTATVGGFFSKVMSKPMALVKKALGFIGNTITKVLLMPVYAVMTVINLFVKNKQNRFRYCSWDDADSIFPSFTTIDFAERKQKKFAFVQVLNDVFASLSKIKMAILFPIAVILLILGIVLFFASSNVVFSFVYTLF